MKKFMCIILLILVSLLFGCMSTPYVSPEGCQDQPSLIQDKFDDPRVLDNSLLGIQFVALESLDSYSYDDAMKVLADIQNVVSAVDGVTYAELVVLIQSKLNSANRSAGAMIFLLGSNITTLKVPAVITACDKILIDIHFQHQKGLIAFYAGKQ